MLPSRSATGRHLQIPAGGNPGTAPQAGSTKWPDLGDTASSTQDKPRRNEAGLIVADTDNSVPAVGGLTNKGHGPRRHRAARCRHRLSRPDSSRRGERDQLPQSPAPPSLRRACEAAAPYDLSPRNAAVTHGSRPASDPRTSHILHGRGAAQDI